MSDELPASWDVDGANAPSESQAPSGVHVVKCVVNPATSITTVDLPHFDQSESVKGTKAARESITKLLTGMCDDFNPLHFRSQMMLDNVTPDPYFKYAPLWSTLSGGRTPRVTLAPAEICEKVQRACSCVPFVKSVALFIVDPQHGKQPITLDELKARNISILPVPNLSQLAGGRATAGGAVSSLSAASSSTSSAVAAATTAALALDPIRERQSALRL